MDNNDLPQDNSCPVRNQMKILGGKWTMLILHHLRAPIRFGKLKKDIPDVSEKMLIQRLRVLEESNYIKRKDFKQIPPKVEYSLSKKGEKALEVIPILVALHRWENN